MHTDPHNPDATDLANSIGRPIDRRDQRGRETPGRWQEQGRPTTANERPQGGCIPAPVYHRKGHFTDMAENSADAPQPQQVKELNQ